MAAPLVGSTEPRLWTRPLRELTPETSLGFRCIAFAEEVLKVELDAWQKFFLIHALEINPDGTFRFRTVLLLVARQNGKTTVLRVLTLWLLWTGRVKLAVGTAQDLDIARRNWREACAQARTSPDLEADLDGKPRMANGQESLLFRNGAEYIIKATTADAARGIPGVGLLLADELRTHRDYEAWGAMSKTAMAVPNALIVGMSNAGDDQSVVLNDLREKAQAGADETLGLFEWSAEPGCALDDPVAWAQANPSLGHGRLTERAIRSSMLTDPPAVFRTEVLCQRVEQLRGAVDKLAWQGCADPAGNLDDLRDRLFACVELAEGSYGEHATLCVAAVNDAGKAAVEVVEAWTSYAQMEADLPLWMERLGVGIGKPAEGVEPYGPDDKRPRTGPAGRWFFPTGPAAARAGQLRALGFKEIKGAAVQEACQGLAADVRAGQIIHRDDPLLTAHVVGAERLISGDGWRFTRGGNVDAAYAAAGAVWAARNHADQAYDPRDSVLWSKPADSPVTE